MKVKITYTNTVLIQLFGMNFVILTGRAKTISHTVGMMMISFCVINTVQARTVQYILNN